MSKQTILVRTRPGQTKIARIENAIENENIPTLVDFAVYRDGSAGGPGQLAGEVFMARVKRVVPAMEAAFIDIGQDKDAFMGLADARLQPHFGPEASIDKISDHVHEGEAVLVQVLADAREAKGAKVSRRVNITGDILVLAPGGEASGEVSIRVSSRIKNKAERSRLMGLVENIVDPSSSDTIIIRSSASGASELDFSAELEKLKNKWAELLKISKNAKPPEHLGTCESALEKYLKDSGRNSDSQIICDDPSVIADITGAELFPTTNTEDIFSHYNISDQVDGLLEPVAPLKSGGSIIIEETSALTAIDVNSASAGAPGKKSGSTADLAMATNLEAIAMAARQIVCRNIAGVIVIDLLKFKSRETKKKLINAMAGALAHDPQRPRIHGITSTGLLEITRPRSRPPLSHIMCEPCGECASGYSLSALSIGLSALEAVLTEVRTNPGLMPALNAHPDVIRALESDASGALFAMEAKLGQPLELVGDVGLKKGSFAVVPSQR